MPDIAATFNDAILALNYRNLKGAEELFRRVLDVDGSHLPALNLLVVVLMSMERFAEAEPFIAKATSLNQNSDVSFYNYGLIAKKLNKPQLALEKFSKALSLNPNIAESWNNRGTVLNDLKEYELAIENFDKAIAIDPRYGDAHVNKGKSLTLLKQYKNALAAYDQALEVKPDTAEAWLGRGDILCNLKRHDEAFAAYERALSIEKESARAWVCLGNAFFDLMRYDESLNAFDKALSIESYLPGAWLGRGNVLFDLGHYEKSIACYDKALSIKPDLAEAWLGKGNALYSLNRLNNALSAYDKALSIKPDSVATWYGRGNVYYIKNQDADALFCYDKAIELNPNSAEAATNKAHTLLSLGNYEEGWKLYEWRWKMKHFISDKKDLPQPLWRNDFDINGKSLLVYWEQGLGDTIQFCRYINLLRQAGAKVIFEVQKPLFSLIRGQNWDCDVIEYGNIIPPFDAHCPLMSLPFAFRTTLESIPDEVPYIISPIRQSLAFDGGVIGDDVRLRVGLVWSGNPNHREDARRSINLKDLIKLLNIDCRWFGIQKDIKLEDRIFINACDRINDLSEGITQFDDTALIIENLDLVISVDTSVAHLAGAMGKPVWVLLPFHADFRWLRDRADSPWYPTARLYRQTKDGDWSDVLERVANDLKALKKRLT